MTVMKKAIDRQNMRLALRATGFSTIKRPNNTTTFRNINSVVRGSHVWLRIPFADDINDAEHAVQLELQEEMRKRFGERYERAYFTRGKQNKIVTFHIVLEGHA